MDAVTLALVCANVATIFGKDNRGDEDGGRPPEKRTRRFEPRGNPYESSWYKQLNDPRCWDVESTRWLSWRRRFLLPRDAFRDLMLKILHIFPTPTLNEDDRCIDNVVFRNVVCPVELKVMGLLRQMARGIHFDGVGELTNTEAEIHRVFFIKYMPVLTRVLYPLYVSMPSTEEELAEVEKPYDKMGFPGCVGSTDVTHVPWGACPASERNDHVGKSGVPTLAYSVSCDHACKIMNVAAGVKGAENDKITVRFDGMVSKLRTEELYTNFAFRVNVVGNEWMIKRGAYFICDGGYLRWRCLQGVSDVTEYRDHFLKWSKMMESVRKDIECVFGRMKKRFAVLTRPSLLRDKNLIDDVFFFCATLHNLLLEYDGLDKYLDDDANWLRAGAADDDEAQDNDVFDRYDARMSEAQREAAARGIRRGRPMPRHAVIVHGDDPEEWAVLDTGYHELRDLLARHFVKAWDDRRVQWPKRFADVNV